MFETKNSKIELLSHSAIVQYGVEVYIKRDDLIHPVVSGNKWRKLKYHFQAYYASTSDAILTFGGAHSNHIIATAHACKAAAIPVSGIIRGEEPRVLSPTLQDAKRLGMKLIFVSRQAYRSEKDQLALDYAPTENTYVIPEGGAGPRGLRGCQEILDEVPEARFHRIAVSSGTGTTAAGILASLRDGETLSVYPALKGDFTSDDILSQAQANQSRLHVSAEYHFGGYAKTNQELIKFIRQFHAETGCKLDPVYTGKMMFGLFEDITKGEIPVGSRVLAIHTGGLQGIRGIEQREGIKIFKS